MAFLLAFGAALLWGGVRRLFNAGRDANKTEAIVWGSVGVVVGAAMLALRTMPTNGSASRH